MTTITFVPKLSQNTVNWSDPTIWSGGVVPNNPAVDVVIPLTTVASTGQPYISFITQDGSYSIGSLSMTSNYLIAEGTLSIAHDVTLNPGAEIDFGFIHTTGSITVGGSFDNNGIDIQGQGSLTVAGLFRNETQVVGTGLSITAGALTNGGALTASMGNLNVTVSHGGFTNLSGTTLTGGTYEVGLAGGLYLDVGAVIDTAAATITLHPGGTIYSFDDVGHSYVPFTSSLHRIAAGGVLNLEAQTSWTNLTVDGSVLLSQAARLTTPQLTVDAGGIVSGTGTLDGPIVDNGKIVAGIPPGGGTLVITGPVSGTGTLEIDSAITQSVRFGPSVNSAILELQGATSTKVVFNDAPGILILDDPASFSGPIAPAGSGDQILLRGIALSSVTSYSYSGDDHGGTLAIHTTSGETDLHFLGGFVTADFTLSADPQSLSSLRITNTGSTLHTVGTTGNDTFTAPSGRAGFFGNGGTDTVIFNFKLTDATISFTGNQVVVDTASSHTVLNGFSIYKFSDGTVNEKSGDPLVDPLFYYSKYQSVWLTGVDAAAHYHTVGWHAGLDPDAFFSTTTYLELNPAVKASGVDPLIQFDQGGWKTSDPSIAFDVGGYLAANPDVAAAQIDPLAHFLQYGAQEGRLPIAPTMLVAPNGFDFVYYLQHNPDVAAAHVDPLVHFETIGWKEGRNPDAYFDIAGYLAHYGDVAAAGINPLGHYDQSGWKEGRDPSPQFDTKAYLAAYPDVAAAHIDPLVHFLQHGLAEGRSAHGDGVWG